MILIKFHFTGNTSQQDKDEVLRLLGFRVNENGFVIQKNGAYLLDVEDLPVEKCDILAIVGNPTGMGFTAITDLTQLEFLEDSYGGD